MLFRSRPLVSADPGFVHLHVHSAYSLLEGAMTIGKLAEFAKADKQPALALTDTDNMFGGLEFSEKLAGSGIQPIVGCTLAVDFGDEARDPRQPVRTKPLPRVVFLATSEDGYRRLAKLSSRAFLETPSTEKAHLKLGWLAGETDGLIVLTGGPAGPIDTAIAGGQSDLAASRLATLKRLFGDRLYVEVQRHGTADERATESPLVELAYAQEIPLVATNEPFFARREDYEAHDALICIAEGKLLAETERRQLTAEHYFKSRAEMAALFADLPEALANSVEIARRCNVELEMGKSKLPLFPTPEGVGLDAYLLQKAKEGLAARLNVLFPDPEARAAVEPRYLERLEFEAKTIVGMGFPGYFLIVADFINWAKSYRDERDRKSTRLNSSHSQQSRMPSSA